MKSKLKELESRTEYYQSMIKEMLLLLGVDISKITFIKGMDFHFYKLVYKNILKNNIIF